MFNLLIYLIKRQQDLKYFIKEFKYRFEEKYQTKISLKELLYNLLRNSEDECKIKMFQLLHVTNPVPFLNYFFSSENELELEFHPETYWITENTAIIRIHSFSLDQKCRGKTKLLNSIFHNDFETTIENSPFF